MKTATHSTRCLGSLLVVCLLTSAETAAGATPAGEIATLTSDTRPAPNGPCRIAGTFVLTAPPFLPELGDQTLIAMTTVTPVDPTCRRFTYTLVPVNPELSFAGIFSEATTPPGLFGSIVRTGGVYELSAIAHSPGPIPPGLPIRAPVLYFWTYEGTVSCVDPDCERILQEGFASLYSNIDDPERIVPELGLDGVEDQDLDDDGFPDEGEIPILGAPFPLTGRRVGAQR